MAVSCVMCTGCCGVFKMTVGVTGGSGRLIPVGSGLSRKLEGGDKNVWFKRVSERIVAVQE